MIETIQRDAGDKFKGPRLQKLRVVSLMLDAVQETERAFVYGAIEHKEDVYVKKATPDLTELYEQNKNFDSSTNFTFNSSQVTNTMVSFLDIWIERSMSAKNVFFGYYTTASIGKESYTEFIKSSGMELPDKPILELLQAGNFDYPKLFDCVKKLIVAEYLKQYSKPEKKGFIENINNFSDEEWKNFLKCIKWEFGECDEVALKEKVLDKVRNCRFFSQVALGKEASILSELLELFDERQRYSDVTEKFVHGSDIKLKFLEASSVLKERSEDPIWKMWEEMPAPTDKRNLIDKINSVCPAFNQRKLSHLTRKVCRSLIEKETFETDRTFLSAKYRVFERCYDELTKLLEKNSDSKALAETDIDLMISHLYTVAKAEINSNSQEFVYRFMSESVIEGILLELFESCYLAFDFK